MKNSIIVEALNSYLNKMEGFYSEINDGEIECEVTNYARSLLETAPFLKTLKEESSDHGNLNGAMFYILDGVTIYMIYNWERYMGF